MQMNDEIKIDDLAKVVTYAGVLLLENGAETSRVEDTMKRICFSYGADIVDSYATPSMILISFSYKNEMCHNIKRTEIKCVDMTKIDKVNTLSREVSKEKIELKELYNKLKKIDDEKSYNNKVNILAAAMCSFGFVFTFRGGIKDACIAFVIGGILKILMIKLETTEFTSFFKYILLSAFVALSAILFHNLNLCDSIDKTIIAVDMLLVPGLAITNAIRDIVSGDLISGQTRALEAFFIAIAIALGSGIVFMILGGF